MFSSARRVVFSLCFLALLLGSNPLHADLIPASVSKVADLFPTGPSGSQFGSAIAAWGDVVMVGAPMEGCAAGNWCGAVYVFEGTGGIWTRKQVLTASDPQANAQFGGSIAMQDGWAVVGAPEWSQGSVGNVGAAYIFERLPNGFWTSRQQLTRPEGTPEAADWFGKSVAIDIQSSELAIGAPQQNCSSTGGDCGAVYVYTRSGSSWTYNVELGSLTTELTPGSRFGTALAIGGGTGTHRIFASALGQAVWVFRHNGSSWEQVNSETLAKPAGSMSFGDSLAFGYVEPSSGTAGDLLVGDLRAGKAFWYRLPATTPAAVLAAGNSGNEFGTSVALSKRRAVVGAPLEECATSTLSCGALYLFTLQPPGSSPAASLLRPLTRPLSNSSEQFGTAVAVGPDYVVGGARFAGSSGDATVFGIPPSPHIRIEPDSLDFGPHAMGVPTSLPLTIHNSGAGALVISSLNLAGTNPGDFGITGSVPITVAPGESQILTVTFTPAAAGPRSAHIEITTNERRGTPAQVFLNGFGTATGINVAGQKTVTGPLTPGTQVIYQVKLINYGSVAQPDNPGSEFSDVLPPFLTLVSATASSGTAVANVPMNSVAWDGTIPPLSSVTITIVALIPATTPFGTTITNQGTVLFDADGNPANGNEVSRLTDDPRQDGTDNPTTFRVQSVAQIPTLSSLGLALLMVVIGGLGLALLRRRRVAPM